jgi:subtilisin-like proprotein convertase family protein
MNRCLTVLRWSLVCVVILSGNSFVGDQLFAQSGLRESLERLDTNQDGRIDPDEITPLARPYLERIMRARRMPIDRPNEIDKLQEAARAYSALKNGVSGRDVRPEGESTVKTFGTDPGQPLVPQFGLAKVKFPYTQDDLDFADRTLRSHDRNRDGFIDRAEAARNRWTHRNPFDDDLNKDDRLSRLEMAQRYARRRLLEGASGELGRKNWRTGGEIRSSRREDQRKRDDSQWWRKGGSGTWLTASVMGRFDSNRNGRLELNEAQSLGIPAGRIDTDRDGELSREELQKYLTGLQDEAGDLSEGLPGWFYELDANRDGQVEMSEFATRWTTDKLQEFTSLDRNDDGLLTSSEVLQSKAMVGGSYRNQNAEVLPPRKTIISEIDVSEDYLIGDLNIQISITHSNLSFLDAYLTGPDGQRIELFTEVGGSGDNFDKTLLDDQSRFPITRAKPPYRGTFKPEALDKRQPGLSHFNGKSVKGIWQLVVRGTRSDRFGMLHGWSLIVKPQDSILGATAASPSQDGPQAVARTSFSSSRNRRADDSRFDATRRSSSREQPGSYRTEFKGSEEATRKRANFEKQLRKYNLSPKELEGKMKWFDSQKSSKDRKFQDGDKLRDGRKPRGGAKPRDVRKFPDK